MEDGPGWVAFLAIFVTAVFGALLAVRLAAAVGLAVGNSTLMCNAKRRDRNIYHHRVATRQLRKIKPRPSRPGAHVQQLHAGTKIEQLGDLLCFLAGSIAGTPVGAAAKAALQVTHCAGTCELGRLRQAARHLLQLWR